MNEAARIASLESEVKELREGLLGLMALMRGVLESGRGVHDVRQLIQEDSPLREIDGKADAPCARRADGSPERASGRGC